MSTNEHKPEWHRLTREQMPRFVRSTYEGEVVLIDASKPFDDPFDANLHFNAQEWFSEDRIAAMPWYAEAVRAEDGAAITSDWPECERESHMLKTPPAAPAPLNNLFACPTCNGWHFNISRGGTLVCTSRGNVGTVGCGWRGSLPQPPRQEGEGAKQAIWLIYSNEHKCWWRPNEAGYTFHLEAAGRYTKEQADIICASRSRSPQKDTPPPEVAVIAPEFAAFIADPADTLPANARFVEVEKPHPDSLRLDWLEEHKCTWQFTYMGREHGWFDRDTKGSDYSETLRSALDAAMSAPSAKGATP